MTSIPFKIKIAICGRNGVGKSAVTVRYLTKRFISEYSSSDDFLYSKTICFENNVSEIEILDTCNRHNFKNIRWADSFLIVYSIVDRESFNEAEAILKQLSRLKLPSYYTCLLLGNKSDLSHARSVTKEEGHNLSKLYNCQFHEVSAAESFQDIQLAFKSLLMRAHLATVQRNSPIRRKNGVNTVGVNFSKALGNIFSKHRSDRKRPSLSI